MNTWGTSGAVKRKMVHVSVDICNITQNRNTFRKRNTDHIDQRRSNWNIECRRLCQIRRSCRNKISRRIDPDIIPFFQETIKRRKMVFFFIKIRNKFGENIVRQNADRTPVRQLHTLNADHLAAAFDPHCVRDLRRGIFPRNMNIPRRRHISSFPQLFCQRGHEVSIVHRWRRHDRTKSLPDRDISVVGQK